MRFDHEPDAEALNTMWERMGEWRDEEPGPAVRARFYHMLEAYEEGRREAGAVKRGAFWSWLRQPVWQFAAAACLVGIGVFAGTMVHGRSGDRQEVATLRSEVQNMRQLVALSLLQQQSASDRLKGVTWSYRVEPSDTEVLSALLRTVNNDANVNVRLSAVDALRTFGDSPVARRGIAQSLPKQTSPLVQVALLELIRDLNARDAYQQVRALAESSETDDTVRQRATRVAAQLGN